jgi:cobalt-zinc-cadmium efflux system membrane fusion protein
MTKSCARSLRRTTLLVASGWILVAQCVIGCRQGNANVGELRTSEEPHERRTLTLSAEQIQHGAIRWAPAEQVAIGNTIEAPGHLLPDEDRTAHLGAPARGRIVTIRVNVGDRVSAGQPLVTLQSQEAVSARADVARAEAELRSRQAAANFAGTARDRAERLLELKAASRQDVERARTDDELARAAQSGTEAEVERARAALTQLGVTASGEMVIRTPIAGVVLKREAIPGAVVDAGAALITVSNIGALWLEAAMTEAVATSLRPGAGVRFQVPAFANDTFEARIQNVGAGLDPLTRTVTVRAVVSNPSGRLRPEMFAKVWVNAGATRGAVMVPGDAVQLLDDRPVVFVAHSDEPHGTRFERRDVELGSRTGNRAEIVKGVQPGDLVVGEGAFAVKSEFARAKIPAES